MHKIFVYLLLFYFCFLSYLFKQDIFVYEVFDEEFIIFLIINFVSILLIKLGFLNFDSLINDRIHNLKRQYENIYSVTEKSLTMFLRLNNLIISSDKAFLKMVLLRLYIFGQKLQKRLELDFNAQNFNDLIGFLLKQQVFFFNLTKNTFFLNFIFKSSEFLRLNFTNYQVLQKLAKL